MKNIYRIKHIPTGQYVSSSSTSYWKSWPSQIISRRRSWDKDFDKTHIIEEYNLVLNSSYGVDRKKTKSSSFNTLYDKLNTGE